MLIIVACVRSGWDLEKLDDLKRFGCTELLIGSCYNDQEKYQEK